MILDLNNCAWININPHEALWIECDIWINANLDEKIAFSCTILTIRVSATRMARYSASLLHMLTKLFTCHTLTTSKVCCVTVFLNDNLCSLRVLAPQIDLFSIMCRELQYAAFIVIQDMLYFLIFKNRVIHISSYATIIAVSSGRRSQIIVHTDINESRNLSHKYMKGSVAFLHNFFNPHSLY